MSLFDEKIHGTNLNQGFKLQSEQPLDARLVVNFINDLTSLSSEHGAYKGMLVYVEEKQSYYSYDGSNWLPQNIFTGEGESSLQQTLDTESWNTSNEVVKDYVTKSTPGANNGLTVNGTVNDNGNVTISVGAFGKLSTMMNGKSQTIGGKSHAEGSKNIALENNSHAEGNETFAAGAHSHAEGNGTSAVGNASHTEGGMTVARGEFSHAEGNRTSATNIAAHAEGVSTTASGQNSHTEGNNTLASADSAHAEGINTKALKDYSHAEGNNTTADGISSHAEGSGTKAFADSAHAEGTSTEANGESSHAEGQFAVASEARSHAEGINTKALGENSHAEGNSTEAKINAHAEGSRTKAYGENSHAEGFETEVTGYSSHAEGGRTKAKGPYNHVGGFGTISNGDYQTVIGRANKEDASKAFIIGNGKINSNFTIDNDKRTNAAEVDWDGTAWFAKDIKVGGTGLSDVNAKTLATTEYVDTEIASFVDSAPETLNTLNELAAALGDDPNFATTIAKELGKKADTSDVYKIPEIDQKVIELQAEIADINLENGTGENSLQQILDTNSWNTSNNIVKEYVTNSIPGANNGLTVKGTVNYAEDGKTIESINIPVGAYGKLSTMMNGKSQTIGGKSHTEGSKTIALENNAHAEGNETFAAGAHSHAEGNTTAAIGNASHAEGGKTIARGEFSHTEGYETEAIGNFSHAEGVFTKAYGEQSHVEGNETETGDDAPNAHAEGYQTHALASAAHAEGKETIASGMNSHAEGYNNLASGVNSHAEGSDNEAFSDNSHVEGWDNTVVENANYSHAEGVKNTIYGIISHAEGSGNSVHSDYAHAEGSNHDLGTKADYAHVEGIGNSIDGYASHVEGGNNSAKGPYNHVNGFGNISDGEYQTVIGRANEKDSSKAFIIGNGEINSDFTIDDNKRKNAVEVDWDGNARFAGNVAVGAANKVLATKDEVDEKLQQHTHQLAGYGELESIDLRNVTTLEENSYADSQIMSNSLSGANGSFTINYSGYVELSVCSNCGDSSSVTYIDIFNENNLVSAFSWNSSNSKEVFNYKGKVDKIEVYTAWAIVDFIKFNGTSNIIAQDGFMSVEDKEKLDSLIQTTSTGSKTITFNELKAITTIEGSDAYIRLSDSKIELLGASGTFIIKIRGEIELELGLDHISTDVASISINGNTYYFKELANTNFDRIYRYKGTITEDIVIYLSVDTIIVNKFKILDFKNKIVSYDDLNEININLNEKITNDAILDAHSIVLNKTLYLPGDELIYKNADNIHLTLITDQNNVVFGETYNITNRYFGYVGIKNATINTSYVLVAEIDVDTDFDMSKVRVQEYHCPKESSVAASTGVIIGTPKNGKNFILYPFKWTDDKSEMGFYFDAQFGNTPTVNLTLCDIRLYKQHIIQSDIDLTSLKDWKCEIYQNNDLVKSSIGKYALIYNGTDLIASSLSGVMEAEVLLYKPLEEQFTTKTEFKTLSDEVNSKAKQEDLTNLENTVNAKGLTFMQYSAGTKVPLEKGCLYYLRCNTDTIYYYNNGTKLSEYTEGFKDGIVMMASNIFQGAHVNFFAALAKINIFDPDADIMNSHTITTLDADDVYAMSESNHINVWKLKA